MDQCLKGTDRWSDTQNDILIRYSAFSTIHFLQLVSHFDVATQRSTRTIHTEIEHHHAGTQRWLNPVHRCADNISDSRSDSLMYGISGGVDSDGYSSPHLHAVDIALADIVDPRRLRYVTQERFIRISCILTEARLDWLVLGGGQVYDRDRYWIDAVLFFSIHRRIRDAWMA